MYASYEYKHRAEQIAKSTLGPRMPTQGLSPENTTTHYTRYTGTSPGLSLSTVDTKGALAQDPEELSSRRCNERKRAPHATANSGGCRV